MSIDRMGNPNSVTNTCSMVPSLGVAAAKPKTVTPLSPVPLMSVQVASRGQPNSLPRCQLTISAEVFASEQGDQSAHAHATATLIAAPAASAPRMIVSLRRLLIASSY
jgi:hypothetical protein